MRAIAVTILLTSCGIAGAQAPASNPAEVTAPTTIITTTPAGTTVKTTAVDPDLKMICQQTETLGTRLGGHKDCRTRRAWREWAAENRMALDRVQLDRASNPKGTGY